MPNTTFSTTSSSRLPQKPGSAASRGMASSLVAINTASSVPGVMTRLAYRLAATAENPHWGTLPSAAPGTKPQRPPPASACSMRSPWLRSSHSMSR